MKIPKTKTEDLRQDPLENEAPLENELENEDLKKIMILHFFQVNFTKKILPRTYVVLFP